MNNDDAYFASLQYWFDRCRDLERDKKQQQTEFIEFLEEVLKQKYPNNVRNMLYYYVNNYKSNLKDC
jgi:hypothetical protein